MSTARPWAPSHARSIAEGPALPVPQGERIAGHPVFGLLEHLEPVPGVLEVHVEQVGGVIRPTLVGTVDGSGCHPLEREAGDAVQLIERHDAQVDRGHGARVLGLGWATDRERAERSR